MTVLKIFLMFDDLKSFERASQVFCKMSLHLDSSSVFLIIKLSIWVCGMETTEVKCHHITSKTHSINMTSLLKQPS